MGGEGGCRVGSMEVGWRSGRRGVWGWGKEGVQGGERVCVGGGRRLISGSKEINMGSSTFGIITFMVTGTGTNKLGYKFICTLLVLPSYW